MSPPKRRWRCSRLATAERGVAPVVGVVLIVAIAVILVSVLGVFVMDFTSEVEDPSPQASLSLGVDTAGDEIRLEHRAGEELYSNQTRIVWEINGSTYRSSPPDDGAVMQSAESAVFTFDGSAASTGVWTNYPSPGSHNITEQHVITVSVYDTESGKRVYTKTVAAAEVRTDL
jgi:FlaG/FlaF family flagellin (archaellin)